MLKKIKSFFLVLLFLFCLAGAAELKPVNFRELPEHMRSYKNYLIVLVHGMNSSAEIWEENNIPNLLAEYVGDPSFQEHVFAYTFNNPNSSYHENAAQIGDRQNSENWLSRARREFRAKHPSLTEAELPQKYILITHSMGALSARSYIYSDSLASSTVDSDNFKYGFYENDIKKVVFVAPTHVGSSMADFLFYYMASGEGYDKEASGLLKQIINTLDLKNDTFESAWQKAQQKAQEVFNDYLQILKAEQNNPAWADALSADNLVLDAQVSKEQLRDYLKEIITVYYDEAQSIAGATELDIIAQARAVAAGKIKTIKDQIITDLQKSMLNYSGTYRTETASAYAGDLAYNNNNWFKEKASEAIAIAVEKFSEEIYQAVVEGENLFNGQIQKQSDFKNWEEMVAYINQIIVFVQEHLPAEGATSQEFNFKEWLDGQVAKQTEFGNWEELVAFIKTLKIGDQLEAQIVAEMKNRADLEDYVVLMETLTEQNNDGKLKQNLDILTREYTQFKTFEELKTKLGTLKIEEIAEPELDNYVRANTEFESYQQLKTYLKSMSVTAELKQQLDAQIAQYTNFETWEQLYEYVKTVSLQGYLKAQADLAVKDYTGFETVEELADFMEQLDLEKEWGKWFGEVKSKMEFAGYDFVINFNIKDWPLAQQPQLNVNWHNWTQFTPDLETLKEDITEMLDSYRFRIKIMGDAEFSASVKEIRTMINKVSSWNNPLTKLFKIITEIDTAPIGSFPTVKLLIEVNNYCATDQVKKLMDFLFTEIMNKKSIEDGAILSLLKEDPATVVMKHAALPTAYDPIQYRNIIPRGMVAFNRRETEDFNQFYYGDLPALQGALSEVNDFMKSSSFLSSAIANGYQLKLLTSANFQRLPSGEARLGALLLSYARGLFTLEGDGLVDLDSMRGKDVKALAGATNYYEKFVTKELSNYVDRGFIDDTVKSEAVCLLVELAFRFSGGTTPPYVRGAIRLVPLFNFISVVVNNSDKIMADIAAHGSILKEEHLSSHLQSAIYDKPMVVMHSLYAVSGNERTKIGAENFQPQTDASQTVTTVPIITDSDLVYLPLAYNFKVDKVSLEGELYDFAPQLASLEYSFNFAPFEKITVDEWGRFLLVELPIAEGQNIISFRVTNKLGVSNSQFMRVIRSTSPLIASNLYPQPFSYTSETVVPLSVDYYNAQFISNNIEASQIDRLLVDGQEIAKNLIEIKRGYDNEYRNYARVLAVVSLSEGLHKAELVAHDVYGHKSYTAWSFNTDITPPKISVTAPDYFSPSLESKMKIELTVSDNLSVVLNNLTAVIKDQSGTELYHFPARETLTIGDHLLYFAGHNDYNETLPDGDYQLVVKVRDLAGNSTEEMVTFNIDTTPPELFSYHFQDEAISTAKENVIYQARTSEPGSVLLHLYNLDKDVKYTYTLSEYELENNEYIYKYTFNTGQFSLTEGNYSYYIDAFDLAGNYCQSASANILIDCTPPEIFGVHAEPLVLTREQVNPYQTKIEYQIKDDSSPLKQGSRLIAVKAKIVRRSDQQIVKQELLRQDISGTYTFNWSAGESSLLAGAYLVEITATDIWGNSRKAYTEVIKDGITPEITSPKDAERVAGIVSLIGRISDTNWSNIKDFEKYVLYWSTGYQEVPANLNNIDSELWQTSALDVPFINRKQGDSLSNVSYREVQKDTLIGYWNTEGLANGKYTLMALAYEEGIGATAATVKHLVIDSSLAASVLSPYAGLKTKIAAIDFAVSKNLRLEFFNARKKANIGVELIAPDGEVAFYKTFSEVAGLKYYGQPEYTAGENKGLFIWADEAGWHLRLSAGASGNVSCNIKIAGVAAVKTVDSLSLPKHALSGGLLTITDDVLVGTEKGFDLILNENITSLYIESDLGEKSFDQIAREGSDLLLGAAAYCPKYNPYIIELTQNNLAGNFQLSWDGRLPGGGYAGNGIYTLRVAAAGYDGLGFNSTTVTFNVSTPFVFAQGNVVPQSQKFDAFDKDVNQVTVGFTTNKDIYLTAKVYDLVSNEPVATLIENKKYLGSSVEKNISWNGAYPYSNSTQRKLEGKYKIVLTADSLDGSHVSSINYSNVKIVKNAGSDIVAKLDLIGESTPLNGELVQATKGASDYYWSAHGAGKYSVPQSFKYQVAAEGEQIVSLNPAVPFAGLYHRGFETVKLVVEINYRWDIDYKTSKGASWKSYNAGWADGGDIYNVRLTTANTKYTGKSGEHGCGFQKPNLSYSYVNPSAYYLAITIKDTEGNIIIPTFYIERNGWSGNIRGLFYINVTTHTSYNKKYGRCHIYSEINDFHLLDNIKYSRLTNRFYAHYGYVNAAEPNPMNFNERWNDYDQLAFVPPQYFTKGSAALVSGKIDYDKASTANGTYDDSKDLMAQISSDNALMKAFIVSNNILENELKTAHYSYLEDEYFEFIPLAMPVSINYECGYITINDKTRAISVVTVNTNFSIEGKLKWPITEAEVTQYYNEQLANIKGLAQPKEIENVDYTALPYVLDKSRVDFGGFGRSFHEISGIISKHEKYQENVAELFDPAAAQSFPENVIRDSISLKLLNTDNPDIDLAFNNDKKEASYSNDLTVIANYSDNAGSDTIQAWSTERDPFINNGIIDSHALIFNENDFRPESDYINIADAYFDDFNRPLGVVSQNIHPIDFYTFVEHGYYDKDSGRLVNPNLDLEKWSIALYDKAGDLNEDLKVVDVKVDSANLLNNKFKVKLKLDAIEKRLVEITGEAAGPYELIYFDGNCWELIATSNTAVSGSLAWWDVGRLNGLYSVILKVYEGEYDNSSYNLTKSDLYVGELLKAGIDDAENKRVTSPYKRAEIYFHPNSYSEDKLITVTPVELNELNISNRPDVYSIGPIVEILPHGSEFPDAAKRPTLVFRYSNDDLLELTAKGIDIDKLGLHYLNESGEVEDANSEVISTNYGIEIRTVLSHFSPYVILEGAVPALPTVNAAFSMINGDSIKIYGVAEPNATLEVVVDDDNVFGNKDGIKELRERVIEKDIANWIFNNRKWSQDYIGKLNDADRSSVIAQRNNLFNKVQTYIYKNEQNRQTWHDLYQELVAQEAENVALISNYLAQQKGLISKTSGVKMISDTGLLLECTVPTFDACVPEELFIERINQEIVQQGQKARSYFLQTDERGHFECDVAVLPKTEELYVYVTYALSQAVKNRPVARINLGRDPEAPSIVTVNMRTIVNKNTYGEAIPVSIDFDEECKLLTYLYDSEHNLLTTYSKSDFFAQKIETKLQTDNLPDGEYFYSFVAVDSAGNASRPLVAKLLVDTVPPQKTALAIPAYINPQRTSLNIVCTEEKDISVENIKIFYNDILIAQSASNNFKFKAVSTGSGYLNGEYKYQIILMDRAGNDNLITGSIVVDTVLPDTPQGFSFLNIGAQGIETIWSPALAEDLADYLLAVKNDGNFVATINVPFSKYYDLNITKNSFYKYELYARDRADNLSADPLAVMAYAGDNCAQKTLLKNEALTVTYNECELFVPAYSAEETNLFVIQQLAKTEYPRPHVPGRVYASSAYRLLASERSSFTRPLEIKIKFDPEIVTKNQLRRETIRVAYWNGNAWVDEDMQIKNIDIAAGEITAETNHFTDFILLADMEYGAYDADFPVLRFESLRNNDYLDPAVSLNLMVSDATSAINTANMQLLLNGVSYNIPAVAFVPDLASAGRSGILALNIKNIAGTLAKGKHQLQVVVFDLGNNSSTTPLISFSTEPDFSVKDILTVPCPFGRAGTHFTYQLSVPANDVEIKVYTTNGRLVKEIKNCANQAGFNKTFWDGKDLNGQFVANDVYLYVVIVTSQDGERFVYKSKTAAIR